MDLPTASVREEILSIHLKKKRRNPSDFELKELVMQSVGFSGAELEEAVREGLYDAFAEAKELRTEHIARALNKTYPLSRTMRDQIEELRRWAKIRARLAASDEPEPLPAESSAVPKLAQEATRNPFIPGAKA